MLTKTVDLIFRLFGTTVEILIKCVLYAPVFSVRHDSCTCVHEAANQNTRLLRDSQFASNVMQHCCRPWCLAVWYLRLLHCFLNLIGLNLFSDLPSFWYVCRSREHCLSLDYEFDYHLLYFCLDLLIKDYCANASWPVWYSSNDYYMMNFSSWYAFISLIHF